jgi:5-methylthioribose kinase
MQDDYQRKMKEIFIVVKHHGAIVIGIILIPKCSLARVALKTMHRASVIQMVKQTVQLFRENFHSSYKLIISDKIFIKLMPTIHHHVALLLAQLTSRSVVIAGVNVHRDVMVAQ